MTFTGADLNVRHPFGIVSIHNMPIFDRVDSSR